MLYKHPGSFEIHEDKFDYIIVEDTEIQDYIAKGWFLTTPEAKAASGAAAVDIPANEKTSAVAEYLETISETKRRGRPRKVTEVEVIPSDI